MSEYICQFCSKLFVNSSNLIRHQKTTKKCLSIQLKNNVVDINKVTYDCDYCVKQFTSKNGLEYHLDICKIKNVKQSQTDEKIKKLELAFQELKNEKSNITINNTQNIIQNNITFTPDMSILSLTEDILLTIFRKKYTLNTLINGRRGMVEFANNYIINTNGQYLYGCTDKSRNRCINYDKNGNIERDDDARNLAKILLIPRIQAFIYNMYYDAMQNLIDDILDTSNEKKDRYIKAYEEIRGITDEKQRFFANDISRSLPTSLEVKIIEEPSNLSSITLTSKKVIDTPHSIIKKVQQQKDSVEVIFEDSDEEKEDQWYIDNELPKPPSARTAYLLEYGSATHTSGLYKK